MKFYVRTHDRHTGTEFDIGHELQNVGADPEEISEFFRANRFLTDGHRIVPRQYKIRGAKVILLERGFYQRPSELVTSVSARITSRLLRERPNMNGGRPFEATFQSLLGNAGVREFAQTLGFDDRLTKRMASLPIVEGKLFKSHAEHTYEYDLRAMIEAMEVVFRERPSQRIILLVSTSHPIAGRDKLLRAERVRSLFEIARPEKVEVVEYRYRYDFEADFESPYEIKLPQIKDELIAAWAIHLDRPIEKVANAVDRLNLVDIYHRGEKRFQTVEGYLSAVERLTAEIVDGFDGGGAEAANAGALNEIRGVDAFRIGDDGILLHRAAVEPSESLSDLAAKHAAALAAFKEFRMFVGSLENTHYRAFMRFVDPLQQAVGVDLERCDAVMLNCLNRPFGRLLGAAKRDEQKDSATYSEFEPIRETHLAQLEWLATSISDLAKALESNRQFEVERSRLGVTQQDLDLNEAAIMDLIGELQGKSIEIAERLNNFLALNKQAKGNSPELAHAILGSVHNMIGSMIEAIASTSHGEPNEPSNEPDHPGWDRFREQVGENIANLVSGRFGLPGLAAIVTLYCWFNAAAPSLAANTPALFEALKRAFDLLGQ